MIYDAIIVICGKFTLVCRQCNVPSGLFDSSLIEEHVNTCLDEGDKRQQVPPKQDDRTYSKAQQEIHYYWVKKLQQEEEDRKLALMLNEEPIPPAARPQLSPQLNLQDKQPSPSFTDDLELARLLQLQEEQAFKEESSRFDEDRKMAELIMQREENEWESTLQLIRTEAKAEADAELARLLQEKETLSEELESARTTRKSFSLGEIEPPENWDHQDANFSIMDVTHGSEEFERVAKEFRKGMPNAQIISIQRNQNIRLWTWYQMKKQQIEENNDGNANEMMLFHGSRNGAYETILKDGFDHRVANLGGSLGGGIYFAPSSQTSSGYCATVPGTNHKKMLYCRVALGSVGQGGSGMRRPPERGGGILHDSVGNQGMYVIFDNCQSYPEYCICFV